MTKDDKICYSSLQQHDNTIILNNTELSATAIQINHAKQSYNITMQHNPAKQLCTNK